MNPWLIKRTIDMQKWQRSTEYLGVLAYSGNEKGHRIELTMRSGEANLPLDGYTVRGYFYLGKPENPEAVMPVKGSASGNLATLDFPAEAYAVGQASVVVCAEKTGEQIPLYSGSYTVRNGSAKVILDPSKTIPSLSALLGEIEDMRNVTADGRAQQKQMAEEFAGYQGEIDGVKADLGDWTGEKRHNPTWTKERVSSSGVISSNEYYLLSDILNPNGEKVKVEFIGIDDNVKCFAPQWNSDGTFVGGSVSPTRTEDFIIYNGNIIRIQAFYNTTSTNISPYEDIVKSAFKITVGGYDEGTSYEVSKEAAKEVIEQERPCRDISLVIPDTFWIDKTKRQAMYLDNIMLNGSYKEVYSKSSYKAKYEFDEGFIYENTNSGQDTININFLDNRKSVAANPNIVAYTPSAVTGTKKILIIGDSLTASGRYPRTLQTNLRNMGMETEFIGTVETTVSTVKHEGHAGWRAYTYVNCEKGSDDYSTLQGDNPFYSASSGKFNFSSYMSHQGFDSVDAVVLAIGTNDTIRADHNSWEEIVKYYYYMIDSIKQYDSNITVFIWLEPLRALNNHSYTERDKAFVNVINKLNTFQNPDNPYSSKVTLLPIGMFIDPYSYPTTEMEISPITQRTFSYIEDTVHGGNDWIFQNQIADAMATSIYYNLIN